MGINLVGDRVEVFKFEHTGLFALIAETTDYVRDGHHTHDNIDLNTCRYVNEDGMHKFVFDRRRA